MPQQIEVPGFGIVEFPDGMNDAAIAAAIKQNMPTTGQAAPAVAQAEPTPEQMQPYTAMRSLRSPARAALPGIANVQELGTAVDNGVRMAANGMTFGLADKLAGGMNAVTGQAPSYDAGVKAERARTEEFKKSNPVAAGAAEMAGGLGTGVGLIKNGITIAGRTGAGLLPRVLGYGTEGALYGAAHGAGNTYSDNLQDYVANAKGGAVSGGMIGGGLPLAGAGAGAVYRMGSAFLGPRVEGLGRGASSMMRAAAQADEAGLQKLSQMGPEAMLVDAGPAMLGLGQGAGTGTGPGKSMLVNALRERDAGTGQRLARSLDENLGPAPIPSRIEGGIEQAQRDLQPQYEAVFQGAGPVDTRGLATQLDALALAERGPAQRAARQVRDMLTDPVHHRQLDQNPASLLNTRQAIDGMLSTETDKNTIRVLTEARQAVDEQLATSVPGIKAVDAQFEELARQGTGLQRGGQLLDTGKTAIRPAELVEDTVANAQPKGVSVGPSAEPFRARQGARAEVDRVVGTNVNDLTALERKLATPQDWNYQKMATTFGDEPTARVAEALMNNRKFRQSYQDIVQNSQTAQRMSAAKAMDGGTGGNVPADVTMTGLGLKALNAVAKALSGASSTSTKDEIGRALSSQGPAAQRIAKQLLESAQDATANSAALKNLIARPAWIAASTPVAGRK